MKWFLRKFALYRAAVAAARKASRERDEARGRCSELGEEIASLRAKKDYLREEVQRLRRELDESRKREVNAMAIVADIGTGARWGFYPFTKGEGIPESLRRGKDAFLPGDPTAEEMMHEARQESVQSLDELIESLFATGPRDPKIDAEADAAILGV